MIQAAKIIGTGLATTVLITTQIKYFGYFVEVE